MGTSSLWNVCGDEGEMCKCEGAVRFGDGVSWSGPIHSVAQTMCQHHVFHYHPKTYQRAQHHCQCLHHKTLHHADQQTHPHQNRQPGWLHAVLAVTVLLFLAALVTGKLQW